MLVVVDLQWLYLNFNFHFVGTAIVGSSDDVNPTIGSLYFVQNEGCMVVLIFDLQTILGLERHIVKLPSDCWGRFARYVCFHSQQLSNAHGFLQQVFAIDARSHYKNVIDV